jgi:hypothetical protein
VKKKLSHSRREPERIVRGVMLAILCVFALPVIVSALILMVAVLNAREGSLASVLFPGSYWPNLLSIAFRISLIPGVAYLTYRMLSGVRDRSGQKTSCCRLSFPNAINCVCLHAFAASFKPSVSRMKAIFIQPVCVAEIDRFGLHQLDKVFQVVPSNRQIFWRQSTLHLHALNAYHDPCP